jgi:translation elongation factor EF-1alpha
MQKIDEYSNSSRINKIEYCFETMQSDKLPTYKKAGKELRFVVNKVYTKSKENGTIVSGIIYSGTIQEFMDVIIEPQGIKTKILEIYLNNEK